MRERCDVHLLHERIVFAAEGVSLADVRKLFHVQPRSLAHVLAKWTDGDGVQERIIGGNKDNSGTRPLIHNDLVKVLGHNDLLIGVKVDCFLRTRACLSVTGQLQLAQGSAVDRQVCRIVHGQIPSDFLHSQPVASVDGLKLGRYVDVEVSGELRTCKHKVSIGSQVTARQEGSGVDKILTAAQ